MRVLERLSNYYKVRVFRKPHGLASFFLEEGTVFDVSIVTGEQAPFTLNDVSSDLTDLVYICTFTIEVEKCRLLQRS